MAIFSKFIIVAHRNMLSLFDMSDNQDAVWIDTIEISEKDHIREVQIKMRPRAHR